MFIPFLLFVNTMTTNRMKRCMLGSWVSWKEYRPHSCTWDTYATPIDFSGRFMGRIRSWHGPMFFCVTMILISTISFIWAWNIVKSAGAGNTDLEHHMSHRPGFINWKVDYEIQTGEQEIVYAVFYTSWMSDQPEESHGETSWEDTKASNLMSIYY